MRLRRIWQGGLRTPSLCLSIGGSRSQDPLDHLKYHPPRLLTTKPTPSPHLDRLTHPHPHPPKTTSSETQTVKQAHWFYEDFVRPNSLLNLPSYHLKTFTNLFFEKCDFLTLPSSPPPQAPPPHHLDFLFDLIQTEKTFANDLFTIINRIASAYSPTNFPPPHLDRHFRLIKSIFRAHNSFLSHSILPIDPPQPTYHLLAFVSLFNQLIRHLLPAYHRYCHPNGWAGAGGWSCDPHVNSNHLLIQTLLSLQWPPGSLSPPPPHSTPIAPCPPIFPEAPYPSDDLLLYDSDSAVHASLTVFFALPFARLFYYRRLSHFLLQILQHGRPKHKAVYDSAHQISILLDWAEPNQRCARGLPITIRWHLSPATNNEYI
ncbi:hypothetical protein PGT21_020870 [Puccinia graminis f. sp. tritici]|uniref:mRNA decapping protein 2 Box A domain-containing protein n=1 Tax=Puccinia graminis f. sp. tritici TaxID=56615 RepID=A0A5B0QJ19_PUCGR|nr:hypothetical protein PGT21_020870 [Puccinia graminis f. sp. tritici]